MNKQRRKQLTEAIDLLSRAMSLVEDVSAGENEAYDNLPEGIQEGDRGEAMNDNVFELDSVVGDIEDLNDRITEIIEK